GLERRVEESLVGLELMPGIGGAAGGGDREQQEHPGERAPEPVAPPPRPLRTPYDLVEAEPKERGRKLVLREVLAVALRPRVGRDRLLAFLGRCAGGTELEAQRRGEALPLRVAGFAFDDQRNDAIAAPEQLEAANLLLDIFALRCVRRTDDDQ